MDVLPPTLLGGVKDVVGSRGPELQAALEEEEEKEEKEEEEKEEEDGEMLQKKPRTTRPTATAEGDEARR